MKKLYFLLASFSTLAAFAQPANDDCSGAIAVQVNQDYNCGIVQSGTLVGATASNVTDNGAGTPNNDVWFTFVATHPTHKFSMLNRVGNDTDLVHEIMVGTCDGLQSINISDPESSTVNNLTVGTTYYIRVFSYYATPANTTFDVCIGAPPPPPANDECFTAIPAVINQNYLCTQVTPGTTASATASNVSDNGAGTPNDDVWFSFVATSSTHKFSLLNITGDTSDLVHEIMTGTCDGLQSLNISDPETSTVSNLQVGQTYYVRVFSYATTPRAANFNLCIGAPPAPPANDECWNAVSITPSDNLQCTGSVSGALGGATASNVPDNGAGTPNDDVWYSFVASSSSHVFTISNIQGTPTDLVHEVLSGDCNGALTSVNVSDPNSSTVNGLTVGTTYYIRIFSSGTAAAESTTFNVCVTTPPVMTNDECWNAVALTVNPDLNCGAVTPGTINGATPSNVPDNGAGTPNDDVWFSFVATGTSHKIQLLNVAGTPTDLVHEVLSGDCMGTLTSLNISDPDSSTVSGLTPNSTYLVRVFSYGTSTTANTTFNVCVGTFPPPPANDNCANAIAITPAGTLAESAIDGSVGGATASEGAPAPGCASYSGGDVWYSAIIPADGNLTIETLGSSTGITDFDSGMAVYAGTCDALTLISCDDDGADTFNFSKITLTGRTPGEVVYIRVWEYSNDDTEPFAIGAYNSSLATPSFDNAGFRVYPNPTSDVLNLSYTNNIDTVEVFNLLGQQIIAKAVNQADYTLNLSELPAGTYLVKVTANGVAKTVKVLKK